MADADANAIYNRMLDQLPKPGARDRALRRRASSVLASLTHLDVKHLPPTYSQFYARGAGSHVTDCDGKDFVDFMGSFGPNLLGHGHPAVAAAVARQRRDGDTLAGPTARMVELAELLVRDTVPWATWARFAKNGGDATTLAARIARAATGRRLVLRAPRSYHGSAPMWIEGPRGAGRMLAAQGVADAEGPALRVAYTFNDLASVAAALDEHRGEVAAIVVAAFRWDYGRPAALATAHFLRGVRRLCDDRGVALICDDVRSSFRVHAAGTWADPRFGHGVAPDLTCLSKGMANGHALSAVLGAARWRRAAEKVTATGSFWASSVPFAAALATIPLAKGAIARAVAAGTRLREGLRRQAAAAGLGGFRQTGPVQMPFFHFEEERGRPLGQRHRILLFCAVAAAGGVIFHPHHTMFICGAAHTDADIDAALAVTESAFARVVEFVKATAAAGRERRRSRL